MKTLMRMLVACHMRTLSLFLKLAASYLPFRVSKVRPMRVGEKKPWATRSVMRVREGQTANPYPLIGLLCSRFPERGRRGAWSTISGVWVRALLPPRVWAVIKWPQPYLIWNEISPVSLWAALFISEPITTTIVSSKY